MTKNLRLILTALLALALALGGCSPLGNQASDQTGLPVGKAAFPERPATDSEAGDGLPNMTATADGGTGLVKKTPSANNRLYNKGLAYLGLPGLFPETEPDASSAVGGSYDKRHVRDQQPRHRNPDGSYGRQTSTRLRGDFEEIPDTILGQALSAGANALTTWAEGWLSGYGNAKITVSPAIHGNLTGSVDYLSPLYDSQRTTLFTQLGLRTMPGDRIIGNFGLGARHFFGETAVGYNIFLDQDFSRKHMRGGLGIELWHDWLRMAANYYAPLSQWQPSKDYDRELVQERPARGYDFRLTGYLPFYRHLALNAAVESWSGRFVAPLGYSEQLASDPTVVVAGLIWTPFPLMSLSGETRMSGGRSESRLGLSFNYRFGIPLNEQMIPANVVELTSVENSRHDFVQRQNEIILEYRLNPDRLRISVRRVVNPLTTFSYVIRITDLNGNPIQNKNIKFI
jgi:hypothetical protein